MRNNFIEILTNLVEIPIIQRDYAQGRTDGKTNKIRKDFLTAIFDFIERKINQAPENELELDFIYGFNDLKDRAGKSSFIPIDGQQRLTTLWLLYWLVGVKEGIQSADRTFLSKFVYETRHNTSEFCKNLIAFIPDFSGVDITQEITNQPWYFETWDYDPSVQAMLVALRDIEERYNKLQISSVWNMIAGKDCPFYFYKLDMEKVGLTDDLYIKMNSRGKGLTEFEYFKAGFSEILKDPEQKRRFENSIDQHWIDTVWHIVFESKYLKDDDDIALVVDSCFLNLFNFITSVIAFQNDIQTEDGFRYKDTEASVDLLKKIYKKKEHQDVLFDTLDAICKQQEENREFWTSTFYIDKKQFESSKARFYFQHGEVNLVERCLFNFSGNRGFTLPEQVLLHACLIHFRTKSENFTNRIRIIRNLVVNSNNELRETIMGQSLKEAENFVINGKIVVFENFKTSQIEEEKAKELFLFENPESETFLKELEDSDIFRGSISLFPFNKKIIERSKMFRRLFDENDMVSDFNSKSNLLLTFGDYSQEDNGLTNLMSANEAVVRSFLTLPGYNRDQFFSRTRKIVLQCLDYFIENPGTNVTQKIKEKVTYYASNPMSWKYYFIKYPSFRANCTKGYFNWGDNDYDVWKMRVRQFNGQHWDPFLYEIAHRAGNSKLKLENYGDKLLLTVNRKKVHISSLADGTGFLFESAMSAGTENTLLEDFVAKKILNKRGVLTIKQDEKGHDLEDRIDKLSKLIGKVLI